MFKDAIDQMEDDEYIDKLHKQISSLYERIQELEDELYNLKESAYQTQTEFLDANGAKNRYMEALKETREHLERAEKGQSLERSHYVGYNLIEALNTINKALEGESE